jgi:hypothetical protein
VALPDEFRPERQADVTAADNQDTHGVMLRNEELRMKNEEWGECTSV